MLPWRKGLLLRRARLYESAGNPRAALARRELDFFLEHESSTAASPAASSAETPVAEQ